MSDAALQVELVAADGSRLRADRDHEPDLFWALRGGGGNFGVVTAMEFALYPVGELYAGALFFPWERSAEVLHVWHGLLADLPDTVTSCGRIMQFPPFPDVPESLRGRSFVVIEAACLGGADVAAPLLAPLRGLRPSLDTFAAVAPEALLDLHMDPPLPVPALSDHLLLEHLAPAAIDDLAAVAGPGSGSPLAAVDLRHTGAALARPQPHDGAVGALPGVLSLFAVGVPADPAAGAAVGGQLAKVNAVLAGHAVGQSLNMVEGPVATRQVYPPATYRRLQRVRAQYDPDERFRANHPVPTRG
ncbi:MAG: BBE domain-containing protein [Egibacteraceae bacterium]